MAKWAGKNTSCTIGSNTFGVKSYKVKHSNAGADTTDTNSGGKRQFDETLEHLEFTIEAEFDPTTNPMTNAPTIKAGMGPEIKLYLKAADPSKFFDMPISFIDDVDYDAPVDGIIKFTLTGKSNGPFTLPS